MPSSPADPQAASSPRANGPATAPLPVDQVLRALARAYDEALVAAASDDLEACGRLIEAADVLLAAPSAPASGDQPLQALRDDAQAAHARLRAVLHDLHGETEAELARTRQGRKALAGYGGARSLGDRVESRA